MARFVNLGIIQALPTGSGNLDTNKSPAKISLQFNFLKVFSDINLLLQTGNIGIQINF